jgi:hypothetical protein
MQLKIKEMSNTYFFFNGNPMSLERLDAYENHIDVKYISHCGWKFDADSSVECVQKTKNGQLLLNTMKTNENQ